MNSTLQQVQELKSGLGDYESKINLLMQEIERLNGLIKNKNQDIDRLEAEKLKFHSKVSQC